MARFYASFSGSRGEGSRTGSAQSGISGHIRGWDAGVRVRGYDDDGGDVFAVFMTGGSNGYGAEKLIGRVQIEDGEVVFVPMVPLEKGVSL